MTKITFIGAGSLEFTRELVRDILTFPRLQDAQLCDGYHPEGLSLPADRWNRSRHG